MAQNSTAGNKYRDVTTYPWYLYEDEARHLAHRAIDQAHDAIMDWAVGDATYSTVLGILVTAGIDAGRAQQRGWGFLATSRAVVQSTVPRLRRHCTRRP